MTIETDLARLTAGLAGDEAIALAAAEGPDVGPDWRYEESPIARTPPAQGHHTVRHDPARVLRQVDAIREIVGLHRLTSDPELGKLGELDRLRIEVQRTTLESVIVTLAGIYTEPTEEKP